MTKQIFSSHKNPHTIIMKNKQKKKQSKTIYKWKPKSFEIA